ncbi:MAG TPA: protein-disulfide reductase DsbD [Burkholderiales bacterium]|nr:protein-disulfide reductase DsbD [Burkholderiales bacterium]
MSRFLLLCLALAAPLAAAAEELLEPEKAFRFSARALGEDAVEVSFAIADGYYMYRERFKFEAQNARLGPAQLPGGLRKKDEFFGDTEVYRNAVHIRVPVAAGTADPLQLVVTSQGCADVGVCYVPMESRATLLLAAAPSTPAFSEAPRRVPETPRWSIYASDRDIAALFDRHVLAVIAGFFGLGLLLTFTPCVLPMVPILSSIIAGEGRNLNKRRAFTLSASYVLGMALAYAAAGIAAAYSGTLIAAALQNPWVLGTFAAVFVWLALSMFGLYEIALPGFLHHRLSSAHQRLRGGRIASVAAMGVLSAVIVSPCVAAPLAGALLYISQTRDVAFGGAALFAMALGMGVPLMIVGVSEGALLPKAGPWMNGVKKFFGVLLLAVAIWIASPVLPSAAVMLAWAALLVGTGVYLHAVDRLPAPASGPVRIAKAAGIFALVAGIALLIGALSGSRDPLRPLAGLTGAAPEAPIAFQRVNSSAELDAALRAPGKPVMLDFYADWCVSCKEMEAFTFSDPRVRQAFGRMLLLQADVTANNDEHKALLKRFSLFGPPGIIFFDAQGREIRGLRVVGYQDAERFLKTLEIAQAP